MNILIFRVGSIGDSIVSLPAFHAIKDAHKNNKIFLLCDDHEISSSKAVSSYKIFTHFNVIDGYFSYQNTLKYKNVYMLKKFIKINNIGHVYYLMPARTFLQKIRDFMIFKMLGLKLYGLNLFNKDENIYLGNGKFESEASRLLRKVSSSSKYQQTKLDIKRELNGVKEIAIAIGTKHKINEWGLNKWENLIIKLASLKNIQINFIGGPNDYDHAEILGNKYAGKYKNYCGSLTIPQTIEIIGKSYLFIGHDSGPMHLASLTSTEIVAIFSDKNPPGVWYPENSIINIYRSSNLKEIDEIVIFEYVKFLLNE
jgi:ADP-heptose:LPS heptosyltransferase